MSAIPRLFSIEVYSPLVGGGQSWPEQRVEMNIKGVS